jgi:hypothetical protein
MLGSLTMADDTRDIVIRTAAKLEGVERKLDDAMDAIEALKADLNERKGMEKIVGMVKATLGGAAGSGLTILFSKFTGIPLPK